MTISISPNYTQRNCSWTEWKVIYEKKLFPHQFEQNETIYTIWGYDGPEITICQIWIGEIPATVIETSEITQEQNDLDKIDFESNYMATANQVIDKTEQQRNTIYQASISNFYSPTSAAGNYYLAISLSNLDGYYRHPPGKSKLKIYGIDSTVAKTDVNELWVVSLGVIVDLSSTTATMTFLNAGSMYLSNDGVSSSKLTTFDFPLYVDCEVVGGRLANISGGVTFPGIPGIGSTLPIKSLAGKLVFPGIGDIILSLSCVEDITAFAPKIPTGLCIFQNHFHYTVDD